LTSLSVNNAEIIGFIAFPKDVAGFLSLNLLYGELCCQVHSNTLMVGDEILRNAASADATKTKLNSVV
jgi:hypothetical protein